MAGQKVLRLFKTVVDNVSIAGQDWKKWVQLFVGLLSATVLFYFLALGVERFLATILLNGNTLPAFDSSSLLLAYLIPVLSPVIVLSLLGGIVLSLGGAPAWIQRTFFLLPHKKRLRVEQFRQVFWVMLAYAGTASALGVLHFPPYVVLLSVLVGVSTAPFLLVRALFLESLGRLLPFKLMRYHKFNSLASYIAVCGVVAVIPVFVLGGISGPLFLYAFSLGAIKAEVFYFTQGLETGAMFAAMLDFSSLVYVAQYLFATPSWSYYLAGMPSGLVLVSVLVSIFLVISRDLLLQCASVCVIDKEERDGGYGVNEQRSTKVFLSGVNFLERPAVLFSLASLCSSLSYYVSVPVFLWAVSTMVNKYAKTPLTIKGEAVTSMPLGSSFLDGALGGKGQVATEEAGLLQAVQPESLLKNVA